MWGEAIKMFGDDPCICIFYSLIVIYGLGVIAKNCIIHSFVNLRDPSVSCQPIWLTAGWWAPRPVIDDRILDFWRGFLIVCVEKNHSVTTT